MTDDRGPDPEGAEIERRMAVLRPHLVEAMPLSAVAADAGIPIRTARRWLARYRVGSPLMLARSPRQNVGKRTFPEDLVALIEGMALLKSPPSIAAKGGEWEFRVQLCTDLDAMPIEDASVVWPEDASPYIPVARLQVGAQPSWDPAAVAAIDEELAFSPWHGLAAHRPLGSVMRARNTTYTSSAEFRGKHNGCPMHEPKAATDLRG